MAGLVLEAVTKEFTTGVRAVRDLNLTVADGELVVLVGPSGCGKTTTLRLIAGLEEPTLLAAVETVLADGRVRTPDLGGSSTTTQMADAIVAALGGDAPASLPSCSRIRYGIGKEDTGSLGGEIVTLEPSRFAQPGKRR